MELVKIKNPDFSYWAWSTPWGHVLSLKSFCWSPVLRWWIRYILSFSAYQIFISDFNDKIDSYTKKKPFGTWQFGKIGVLVNSIIQKLKSKHLSCLSFLWWQLWEKIFYTYSGAKYHYLLDFWEQNL